MEVQKCTWESSIGSVSTPQCAAVVDLEYTTSALDESVTRNLIGVKSSPKMLQQPIFSGNNATVRSNMEAYDRQFQRPRSVVNEHHNIGVAGYPNSRTAANTLFSNWEHVHPHHERLIKKTEMTEAGGSAPGSPAGHSGALNAYTKQALDDLVSKILDEDSNSYHLNGADISCDEFKQNVGNQRVMENAPFGCNIWANQKLPAEYVQPASDITVDKQWKPMCTSSAMRMPPGLALPASSQQQCPAPQMQLSQPGSVPPAVLSNEASWLKCVEPTQELTGAPGRSHTMVSNENRLNVGGQDNVISNDQYQQQQALLLAQVQATLYALQNCPQQPMPADQHGHIPQRPAEHTRFGVTYRKPDESQLLMKQSVFVNGKDAHLLPAGGISTPTTNAANAQLQLQQGSDFLQQHGQMPDLSKCMISTVRDKEAGVTMQPFPVPQQAFMQTRCAEPFNNQPSTSRRLLPACFQDSGRPFMRSAAVPLKVASDQMQLEQNQVLVHGPNLRCNQSAWNGNNPRQSTYSQYSVTSNASAEQYNMVGRLTPVMVGPAGDIFCSTISSQICTIPSPVMVGSKFPRQLNASSELYVRLEECFEQLHLLEKEEKHAEAELAQQTPGRIAPSSTAASPVIIPRLPHNPTRVDRLYVESLREHSKVSSLVSRLWQCRGLQQPLHSSIYSVMETWMEGIRKVQARRKEEMVGMANRNNSSASRVQDNKDIVALAAAVTELLSHTRRARTALWCAVQMTSADCESATCPPHSSSVLTDIWHDTLPTTERIDAASQKKC